MTTSPVAPLLQSRVLDVPAYPGLLASLDRFEILDVLGSGGMGVVLLARDPTRPASVAIKVLRPELVSEPRAVHRFLVEARHMQRLSHAHVLPVLEVSDRTEGPYFVLPYMAGGSLTGKIIPGKPLPTEDVLQISIGVADALNFAHSRGLIHRDLKPANVLVDAEGHAYLSDFGLMRTMYNDSIIDVRREHTEGTPAYMSPEVARGEAGDTRCDVYSFGSLLYEMLTGAAPYEGSSQAEILNRVRLGPPVPIRQHRPDAHPDLIQIAETAMARELRDRYASMGDVLADLMLVQQGQPVRHARSLGRRSRRFWWIFGIAAAAVALLLIVSAIVPWEESLYRHRLNSATMPEGR